MEKIHGERILEIQMNFNEKNTLNYQSFEQISELLDKHSKNRQIRVVLFTSGQPGVFSNGLDPVSFIGKDRKEVQKMVEIVFNSAIKFLFFPLPVIGVISGSCAAAGAVFALFSDYRFMALTGRIGFPEVAIGVCFPSFVTMVMKDVVGGRAARDLVMQGKMIKPLEAKNIGLVDELFSEEELLAASLKYAQKFASFSFDAVCGVKLSTREHYRSLIEDQYDSNVKSFVDIIMSENGQEGFRSIQEKRRPVFK